MSVDSQLPIANSEVQTRGHMVPAGKCYIQILPPELLAIIFQEVVEPEEPEPIVIFPEVEDCYTNEFDTIQSTVLSHVCQYWRDIALGDPMLWTRINGRSLVQMETFLERSGAQPVQLVLYAEYLGGDKDARLHAHAVSAVKTHGQRLRRLDIFMVPTRERVDPLLTSLRAPHLECLTITSPSYANQCIDERLSWTPLIGGQASSLRALAVMPVVNWMPSSPFPNLTHLFLSFNGEAALCHSFDILRLLSNAPALKFLHIDRLLCIVRYYGDWQPPSDPIPLRRLRSLVFTSCIYNWTHIIISHLSLPEDVFIRLQNIVNFEDQPAPLPPPSLALLPVTSLDIATAGADMLMVADGPASGLWFSTYYDLHRVQRDGWIPWFRALPGRLVLSHVTHLHINVNYDGDESFAVWNEFLAHMPQVTDLSVLFGNSSDPQMTCYAPTTVLSLALAQENPILCPALRTLNIEWSEGACASEFESYEELPKMFYARARAGHPILRVVMQAVLNPHVKEARFQADEFVQGLRCATKEYETEYELIVKEGIGEGLCAYEMRDVWCVDGEDVYWVVGEEEQPHYILPPYLGGYSWTGILIW